MPEFTCLKDHASDGQTRYPILVGIESARTLNSLSWAPAHPDNTLNSVFAAGLTNNMSLWQRESDPQRIEGIRDTYRQPGQVMPNPVVLAAAANHEDRIQIEERNGVCFVTLPDTDEDADSNEKPLWILDGQHRIAGIAAIEDRDIPIPFVLLTNQGQDDNPYRPANFARIFAQISTLPEPLSDVHKESLFYAFNLDIYGREGQREKRRFAMETAKWLCEEQDSVLWNKIVFDFAEPNSNEAFGFPNHRWAKLIYNHFYSDYTFDPLPQPDQLGGVIQRALRAAKDKINNPEQSALFGLSDLAEEYGRSSFQEAFLTALLEYLAMSPQNVARRNWGPLFEGLRFGETNWDLTDLQTGGVAGKHSPEIVREIFLQGFTAGGFPGGITVDEWLRGAEPTEVMIWQCPSDPETGRPQVRWDQEPDAAITLLDESARPVEEIEFDPDRPNLALRTSANLSGFSVFDPNQEPGVRGFRGGKGRRYEFDAQKVERLNQIDGRREASFRTYLYGDSAREFTVAILGEE